MHPARLFVIKNRMLGANLVSNVIGVVIRRVLFVSLENPVDEKITAAAKGVDAWFLPLGFLTVISFTLWYERPIRRFLDHITAGRALDDNRANLARRRLLNEPFVLIGVDFLVWVLAAFVYSGVFWSTGAPWPVVHRGFVSSLTVGLINVTVAFFVLEFILQRFIAPWVFPAGGLSATPGTMRIGIHIRLIALFFACNLIPFHALIHMGDEVVRGGLSDAEALDRLLTTLHVTTPIFIAVGIWLTFLVANNLTRPFADITRVLKDIRNGLFTRRVRVTTNDEIGYTGDVINEMAAGLAERERLRQSLDLAREVQQSLLPKQVPRVRGLDMAGASLYCDATGGDYYDFLIPPGGDGDRIGVVVGDVSDHGIHSALLMTTARAFLRHRASLGGDPAAIVNDVNRHLSLDVEDSGQFMTLFYLDIDRRGGTIRWVRAGHDPALCYDPAADRFEELSGPGLALGLNADYVYKSAQKNDLLAGQVLVVGTDGIWEAQNDQGQIMGKPALMAVVRSKASQGARVIVDAILDQVRAHRNGASPEDDATVVVIKLEAVGADSSVTTEIE